MKQCFSVKTIENVNGSNVFSVKPLDKTMETLNETMFFIESCRKRLAKQPIFSEKVEKRLKR